MGTLDFGDRGGLLGHRASRRGLDDRVAGGGGTHSAALAQCLQTWRSNPSRMKSAKPTLAFAVIGQARADGAISPQQESRTLGELLTRCAVDDAIGRGRSTASSHSRTMQIPAISNA